MGCCQSIANQRDFSKVPTNWEECGMIIDNKNHTLFAKNFRRKVEDKHGYNVAKAEILTKYASLNDRILHSKLGYDAITITGKGGSEK